MRKINTISVKLDNVLSHQQDEPTHCKPVIVSDSSEFSPRMRYSPTKQQPQPQQQQSSINGHLKLKIDKLVIKNKNQFNAPTRNLVLDNTFRDKTKKPSYTRQNTEEISLPKILAGPYVIKSEYFNEKNGNSKINRNSHSNANNNNNSNINNNNNDYGNVSFKINSHERGKETEPNLDIKDKKSLFKLKTFTKNPLRISEISKPQLNLNDEMYKLMVSNIGLIFSNYSPAKISLSSMKYIRAYAVNSYQGIVRSYNEDRVSIILTITKPKGFIGIWPQCSLFAIYDGHGGSKCCDFLRDKLQDYIIKNDYFPFNPKAALVNGIEKAERDFIKTLALDSSGALIDKSGSCALVALVIDNICYVANVGDSRLIISKKKGKVIERITTDHKPNEENESKRIVSNGGKIYQSNSPQKKSHFISKIDIDVKLPHRVIPGRLAVSRAIGDIEAKEPSFGGNPNVVIATPEVTQFEINKETDFLMMGCDGIFDNLSNEECVECAWKTLKSKKYGRTIHTKSGAVVDMIIKSALKRKTFDNVTALFISFEPFEKVYEKIKAERLHLSSNQHESLKRKLREEIVAIPLDAPLKTFDGRENKLKKSITLSL